MPGPAISLMREQLPCRSTITLAPNVACAPLHRLLQDGKLGSLQSAGYPDPNRNHFLFDQNLENGQLDQLIFVY